MRFWLQHCPLALGMAAPPIAAAASVIPARVTPVPGGQGKLTFVYIHGVYHGAWVFSALHPLMKLHSGRQYLLDLRGHSGEHRVQADDEIGYTEYLEDLTAALDALPGRKLLVGHSLGGLLSMSVLPRSDVAAAVLLATPLPEVIRRERWRLLLRDPVKSLAMILRRDAAYLYHDKSWVKRYFFSATTPPEIVETAFTRIRFQNEPFQLFDDLNELVIDVSGGAKPVMVIAGGEDPTVDESAATMLANQFCVKPVMISGAGHDLMMEPAYAKQLRRIIASWLYEKAL